MTLKDFSLHARLEMTAARLFKREQVEWPIYKVRPGTARNLSLNCAFQILKCHFIRLFRLKKPGEKGIKKFFSISKIIS